MTQDTDKKGDWRVMREDDNNNTFVVEEGLSEIFAREVAADFEARGHKQSYWVEKMPAKPSPV